MMRRGVGRVGRPGLIGTMARTAVVAGTATAVVGGVKGHQEQKAAQQQAAAAPPAAAPAEAAPQAAPAGGLSDDALNQLKELAQLKDQGILTEEEFAAQKAKLLA